MLQGAFLRLANVSIRGLAMGSSFARVLLLTKLLTPEDVGTFGLFTATVAFSVLVIGGDFYTYALRELLSVAAEQRSFVLQHQTVATAVLYLVLLPPQLLLFHFDFLPPSLLVWFLLLLVLEHVAQEIYRLLVALQRQLLASWVLLLRLGVWVWPLALILWLIPASRHLETILCAWSIGAGLAVALGALVVVRQVGPWRWWALDAAWIKRGLGVGLLFFFATLCLKALTTIDRYVVEHLAGTEVLGAYVLYAGLAMVILTFLDTAVFSFLYPRILVAFRGGRSREYRRLMHELAWSACGASIGLALVILWTAPALLAWLGHGVYQSHVQLLWILLAAAVLYAVGMVPHFGLYARGADRAIALAHIVALVGFFATVAGLARFAPLEAAAFGVLVGFFLLGAVKLAWYIRLARNGDRGNGARGLCSSAGPQAPAGARDPGRCPSRLTGAGHRVDAAAAPAVATPVPAPVAEARAEGGSGRRETIFRRTSRPLPATTVVRRSPTLDK